MTIKRHMLLECRQYCRFCQRSHPIIDMNLLFTYISKSDHDQKSHVCLFHPVIYKSHYVCINQPSISPNKVHNISVKAYVCAQGVIYLMY